MWEMIKQTTQGLNRKFPDWNEPYMMISRLMEECGELASEVNHFENMGNRWEKRGKPDKEKLAGEIKNVLWCVTQVIQYYDVEDEVKKSLEKTREAMIQKGYIS
jgi:NTP pyrophosphatase (non-canonical NTP hydrolase)